MARYDDDDDQRVMTLDDLLGPVPDTPQTDSYSPYYDLDQLSNSMSNAVSDKNPSKSQRVRDFLDEHPDARNRDVVDALAAYGVTAADVSNAKAQLKRKGEAPSKKTKTSGAASATNSNGSASGVAVATSPGGTIAMNELEAAITFVRSIGSLDRAKQLLVIIQQVQQL